MIGAKYNKITMGIKKIIKKLLKEPPEMRLEEVIIMLSFLGYKLDRINGSHYIFTKPETKAIIVPSHHNKVHKIYLKKLKKLFYEKTYPQINA